MKAARNSKLTIKDFPVKTLMHDGKPVIDYIERDEIHRVMGDALYTKYEEFARGQTCIAQGHYAVDVEQFLYGLPPLD